MTNKTKTGSVLAEAEVLLKDLEAASRGRRLRKAETEVRDAAKPKTHGERGVALRQAEAEVAGAGRHSPSCVWQEMKPVKWHEPAKPNAQEALARYIAGRCARR